MSKVELVAFFEKALIEHGFESAHFEACQLADACNDRQKAEEMLSRRLSGEPLQYILGEWEFYGITLKVGDGVLIPRQDTETVVETAVGLLKGTEAPTVFDLCAGSGCIGIAMQKQTGAKVKFFEKSREALGYLKLNVSSTKTDGEILETDVLNGPPVELIGTADMVISNPPYIRSDVVPTLGKEVGYEPKMALDGGKDGLVFYREIAKNWKKALKKGGCLVFETGFDQRQAVMEILKTEGYAGVTSKKDLCGNDRVVYGKIQ